MVKVSFKKKKPETKYGGICCQWIILEKIVKGFVWAEGKLSQNIPQGIQEKQRADGILMH